ncbi:MAG TPA: VanZ family protein [Gemmataceae bacterium]|nr:VanZ family protein [Gemmataceae bacterium]
MKQFSRLAWWRSPAWRWLVWLAWVTVSTVLLIGPSLAQLLRRQLDSGENPALDSQIFLLSKVFHVSDYALMAALTAWLPIARRWRGLLLVFLSAHAAGTEWLQQYVETRTGTWHDVAIDHLGLLLGLALTWKWWRPPRTESSSLTPDGGETVAPRSPLTVRPRCAIFPSCCGGPVKEEGEGPWPDNTPEAPPTAGACR